MNTFKQQQRAEPVPKPGFIVGDEVYCHHKGGPVSGRVAAHGKHGITLEVSGQHHRIRWEHVLGHKKRAGQQYHVVEEGEDGMIVQDGSGLRQYVAVPPEAREEQMIVKAGQGQRIALLLKAGEVGGYMGRPGLTKKQITDKRGVVTTKWVRTNPDEHGPAQQGQHVGWVNGDHKGHGQVAAAGRDGVTARDSSGGVHRVPHGNVTHRWEGEGAPDHSPHDTPRQEPEKPNWDARQDGESDKAYAKRVVDKGPAVGHLPEDHGRYFNDGGQVVPLSNLHSTKSDEENQQGGDNGPKRMLAAYHGALGKRDPITVMPHATKEGHHEVVDGNGTLTSAKKLGWKSLPVKVVSREEGERMKAEDAAIEAAKGAGLEKYKGLPPKAKQPTSDPDELFKKGEEGLQQLKEWLDLGKGVASQMGYQTMTKSPADVTPEEWDKPGGMLFIASLKGRDRSEEKVRDDYKGDWSKLLDVVRCTMAADNLHDISDALRTLESKGLKPMQVPKDKFTKPTDVGYRDFNFIVQLPNGMAAEVQFNTKDMLRAKNEAHHYYEVTRKIAGKYESAGTADQPDKWDEKDRQDYQQAFEEQQRIYHAGWADHVKKHYGSAEKMVKSFSKLVLFWSK